MKANLFNFSVDRENKKIYVEREFNAPVSTVWAAWTQSELLEQWWAPKPWKAKTKFMDFREGGYWLYSMIGPQGEEHFSRADYKSIVEQKSFSGLDNFCDSEGVISKDFASSFWEVNFNSRQESTVVNVVLTFENISDLEKLLEMGFQEGFTLALGNLDEVLESQKVNFVI